ncbi:hypothetical protein ZWY2020_012550 [Hordeum vulgare]|nr:hypothetical protein ZWY2020_012550 [Hordeum vulgare]
MEHQPLPLAAGSRNRRRVPLRQKQTADIKEGSGIASHRIAPLCAVPSPPRHWHGTDCDVPPLLLLLPPSLPPSTPLVTD